MVDDNHALSWRPIDTAPRDGTYFDVWIPSDYGGYRVANLKRTERGTFFQYCHPFPADLARMPTHWMPLPPAPTSEAQA